jgi:hypothetical protein
MYLYPEVPGIKKKKYDTRGGWGTVARRSKSQELRKYMSCLFNAKGWCISTTKSSNRACKNIYRPVTYGEYYDNMENDPTKDETLFWVITKGTSLPRVTNNNINHHIDKYFKINYNKLMNDIIQAQEESQVHELSPAQLRQLLLGNSKLNKKNMNKLLKSNIIEEDDSSSDEDIDKDKNDDDNGNNDGNGSDDDTVIDDDDDDDNNMKMAAIKSPKKITTTNKKKNIDKIVKKKNPPLTSTIKPRSPIAKKVPRFPVKPRETTKQSATTTKVPTTSTDPLETSTKPPATSTTDTSPKVSTLCTINHTLSTNHNPNSDRNYFLPNYYKKYPNCTQQCKRCTKIFGQDMKITTKTPAMCCINQFNAAIKCNHAYCTPCYAIVMHYGTDTDKKKKAIEIEEVEATNNGSDVNLNE